jgi:glycosyltransferase involved in cell wall biosynthesis
MRPPAISVVLPCFNAAPTLGSALRSIREQTFADWELILFDDGSTDGSLETARRFARADSRVRVLASSHVGIVAALQTACAETAGGLVARMDADDVAHPERFARQLELMRADPGLAICGTQVTMVGERIGYGRRRYQHWVNDLLTHESIVRDLFVECPIPHPTFLMRRPCFEAVGGYVDRDWAEDYDLCMRLFLAGMRFGKVDAPLLNWRDALDRLSMVASRYSPERFRALKRHYLFQSYLKGRERFHQWGAGEVGKRWLQEWDTPRPLSVVDINPRKIGRRIHGIPVVFPDDLPKPGTDFIVVAVGAPTARDEIREWFTARHYRELDDFLFLA